MASMEDTAARQLWPGAEYESAMQFNKEAILIYGVGGFHNYRQHLREGSAWGVLGASVSRKGGAWAVFVWGVLSEGARRELREQDARREAKLRRMS